MLTFLLALRQVFRISWLTCGQLASVFTSVFKVCVCSVLALTQTALLRHIRGSVCVICSSVFMLCLDTWVVPIEEDEETVDLPSALGVGGMCTYVCLCMFACGHLWESKEQPLLKLVFSLNSAWSMLLFIFFLLLPPLFLFPLYYFSFLVSTKFTLSDGTPPPTQQFVLCPLRADSYLIYLQRASHVGST